MRELVNRLANQIGRRGSFLLFLAMLDLIYGYSLLVPGSQASKSSAFQFLSQVLPLSAWAVLWLVVGALCLIYAFRKKDAVAYAAAMFLKLLWALVFFFGWLFAHIERGYLSATVWGAFALILVLISTWPEAPREAES